MSDFLTSNKFINFAEKTFCGLVGKFADSLNDGPCFVSTKEYKNEDFFSGSTEFLSKPKKSAKWHLGYAITDLTPYDYENHDYYLGGYLTAENRFNNKIETLVDKMQCRIICLDDGSKRGPSFFGTIDCIGFGNSDIKTARRKFTKLLAAKYPEVSPVSINIFSTHAHSCVDTQGLWTNTLSNIRRNYKKNKHGKGTYVRGADYEYIDYITTKIAQGFLSAFENMTQGTLTYAVKDIGEEYFCNKNRKSATSLVTNLTRLVFTPDDKEKTPTIIASVGAHPDVAGLPTSDGKGTGRELCGEYVYYMGEHINKAGYNFMFFNGAICAIYMARGATNDGLSFAHRYEESIRYGKELAKITLSLTKTFEEIENDELLCEADEITADMAKAAELNANYTLWYEDWEPVEEVKVPAILNIALSTVRIPVTNPLIKTVGKLNLVAYKVIREENGTYAIDTEIGYMEIGGLLNIVFVPGEFCSDLLVGGDSLKAEHSYRKVDFPYPSLVEIFNKPLTPFGLANDAIGYIVPDNDFIIGDFVNHYHELICLGEYTGSSIIKGFINLKNNIYYR